MTFDIIQTNYLTNLKWFSPYYSIILGLALLVYPLKWLDIHLPFDHKTIEVVSNIIISLSVIILLIDNILFTRIGHITLNDEKIIMIKNEVLSEFLISNIKNVTISSGERKQYSIKVNPLFEEIIDLNKHDIVELKNYLTNHQIEYQHKSFLNWLKNLNFIKNNHQTLF